MNEPKPSPKPMPVKLPDNIKLRPAKADKRGRPRVRKDDKRYVKYW